MKKEYFSFAVGVILMIVLLAQPGWSQMSEELKNLNKELEGLKESQKAMQKDLQQIKTILRGLGLLEELPQNLFIDISNRRASGSFSSPH